MSYSDVESFHVPAAGEFGCSYEDFLQGLSDSEADWLLYRKNPTLLSVDHSLSQILDCEFVESTADPSWLVNNNRPQLVKRCVTYPTILTDEFVLGRCHNLFSLLSLGIAPMGANLVEERFIVQYSQSMPKFSLTARFDNGITMAVQLKVDYFFMQRECHLSYFESDNPRDIRPISRILEKVGCKFCAARLLDCDCPPRATLGDLPELLMHQKASSTPLEKWIAFTYCFHVPDRKGSYFKIRHIPLQDVRNLFVFPEGGQAVSRSFIFNRVDPSTVRDEISNHMLTLASSTLPAPISESMDNTQSSDSTLKAESDKSNSLLTEATKNGPKASKGKCVCHICGRGFARKYELQRHISAVHEDVRNHVCSTCGKAFALRQNLVSHVVEVHEKKRDFICTECSQAFPSYNKLRRHVRSVHLKERRNVCNECGSSYYQHSDLRRHFRLKHSTLEAPVLIRN